MGFDRLILGENELREFETLLIREKMIGMHSDFSLSNAEILERHTRINQKTRLLISLLLYEKIDAVTLSTFDYSRLIDMGVVEEKSCLIDGTDSNHPTLTAIDAGLEYKRTVIAKLYDIIEQLLISFNIDLYPKSLLSEEALFNLCDSYLFGTQNDVENEFCDVIDRMFEKFNYLGSWEDAIGMKEKIHIKINQIYEILSKKPETECYRKYSSYLSELDANVQVYSVPHACLSCEHDWRRCCNNSEFYGAYSFNCVFRENLGAQRFNKLNGLIMSDLHYGTLFDNSIKFQSKKKDDLRIIEDVYHIVNVDLSNEIGRLPVPQSVSEAIRLRARPEIKSFRNIFLRWTECLYNGSVSEAEYIKKDFSAAADFFAKKECENRKKKSIFHCFCEVIGNQIPYISNISGIVAPFVNRHKIQEEEKHRWLLLTR